MILVLGSIDIRDGSVDEALSLCLEHVRRSRTESGCVSHDVHRHVEHPSRLLFVERWEDRAALDRHFAVPESISFVRTVSALAASDPTIEIHDIDGERRHVK